MLIRYDFWMEMYQKEPRPNKTPAYLILVHQKFANPDWLSDRPTITNQWKCQNSRSKILTSTVAHRVPGFLAEMEHSLPFQHRDFGNGRDPTENNVE